MRLRVVTLIGVVVSAPGARTPASSIREVGVWSYGYVVSRGTGFVASDTVERSFVITSQVFGHCWSRERARRLEDDATPMIKQRLRAAFGERVSVTELRVVVHPSAASAREDRAASRTGSGRVIDILVPVVDDRSSCVPPRNPGG